MTADDEGTRMSIADRATRIEQEGVFLGGPTALFELAGRQQLMILLQEGLTPWSKVLDIGCGCLRGGYWIVHFLNQGCYFGIEPNRTMLDAGLRHLLEEDEQRRKTPTFDNGDEFDLGVFGTPFDYILARSIWTHASKSQITKMLEQFSTSAADGGVLLASVTRRSPWAPSLWLRDHKGEEWVGRSHRSDKGGLVHHRRTWLRDEARRLGLEIAPTGGRALNFGHQRWLKVTRADGSSD